MSKDIPEIETKTITQINTLRDEYIKNFGLHYYIIICIVQYRYYILSNTEASLIDSGLIVPTTHEQLGESSLIENK